MCLEEAYSKVRLSKYTYVRWISYVQWFETRDALPKLLFNSALEHIARVWVTIDGVRLVIGLIEHLQT
jgi:hypothetical protein